MPLGFDFFFLDGDAVCDMEGLAIGFEDFLRGFLEGVADGACVGEALLCLFLSDGLAVEKLGVAGLIVGTAFGETVVGRVVLGFF